MCFRERELTQRKKKKERTQHLLFISKQSKQRAAGAEFTGVSQHLEVPASGLLGAKLSDKPLRNIY